MPHSDPWVAVEFVYGLINVSGVTTIMTGGVHRGTVNPAPVPPYVTINVVPNQDLQIVNGRRVWSELLCDVVGIGTDLMWDAVDQGARAIDDILQAKSGNTTNGRAFSCVRVHPIFFDEVDEGITYVYSGGSYRITARANPT